MFIHDIASYLVNLTKQDVKPDIYSVFDLPGENRSPGNIESEKLTILEILNAIGCRLKNLFGFVKINTTTETIDEGEAAVTVNGDVDNLNFDFKIPLGKTGPQGPAGPGVTAGGTTGQILAKKSNANYDTEWINNSDGGSTVSVNVGNTTTGKPGTNASVTNSGDETNVVLNFTIPSGDTGPAGKQGPAGATGPAGPGVATGGTKGQVLAKKSSGNFDTEWVDPCPYWIGDILVTMNKTNPAQRWPGTAWEQITDCMLRAADDTHPAGSTGGAWDVTQTVEQVAKHTHSYASYQEGYPSTFTDGALYITPIGRVPYNEREQEGTQTSPTGKNKPMPITNKYTACYMWKRTA